MYVQINIYLSCSSIVENYFYLIKTIKNIIFALVFMLENVYLFRAGWLLLWNTKKDEKLLVVRQNDSIFHLYKECRQFHASFY